MTAEKKELALPSRLETIEEVTTEAVEFAKHCGFNENAVYAIDMAMREATANAVKHGNKFDEHKTVNITLENLPKGFAITIRDFGAGFAVEDIPDPTNPENLLKATGRGILFMRNFMEEVEWENHPDGGTIVKMMKVKKV